MDPLPHRRKKTARERREQKERAEARTIGRLLKSCIALNTHRGCAPTGVHAALAKTLSASNHDANDEIKPDLTMVDQAELPDLIDLSDPVEWVPLEEPHYVDIVRDQACYNELLSIFLDTDKKRSHYMEQMKVLEKLTRSHGEQHPSVKERRILLYREAHANAEKSMEIGQELHVLALRIKDYRSKMAPECG